LNIFYRVIYHFRLKVCAGCSAGGSSWHVRLVARSTCENRVLALTPDRRNINGETASRDPDTVKPWTEGHRKHTLEFRAAIARLVAGCNGMQITPALLASRSYTIREEVKCGTWTRLEIPNSSW
jgi:hypothetical protein